MKIAFLNIYQGKVGRGAETFISELTKRLSKDHDVDVIAGNKNAFARWPILWRLFLDPTGVNILVFTLKSLNQIWKEKYDVVIPSNGGWQTLLVRLVTYLYGGKMVISGQSGIGWDDRINLLLFPDTFIATSTKAMLWAKKVNPFVKSVYTPNGVDLDNFTIGKSTISLNIKKPLVLCVGALTKSKNIDLVIKAVASLQDVSLLVVGDGYLREKINYLGRQLLFDRFELRSFPYDQMPEAYKLADVFVLVSNDREAFGIVYVEALASGLTVVARNDEQRREIIGGNGVLVDNPNNISELSTAIKKALALKNKQEARKQAENFSWEKISKSYEKILTNL